MRFPPALLDEIRARLPVSQVVGRRVKLKRQGREYAGLSPFKTEKTPSFFVNDQKGFYHCFATGEHGDIFTFLMKTEGLTFPEAIERLAAEAGVALPKVTAQAQEQQDKRGRLLEVMEASTIFFERQLVSPAGREGLRYLEGRGLTRDTMTRFRLGFSPPGRSSLKEHLAAAGFTGEEMNLAGVLVHGDDIPVSYDRFRNRVMFPITDPKERVVAFGGRALEKDAKPKYLNSPETPLFHKGNLLFNAAKARTPAYERGRVIAVEGYMDAIALSQAGFHEAVAPLGTALTAEQLALLWRLNDEPTLCFDGDSAGKKAAFRAIETALPHLKPGQSLQFAFLPDGLDPDDLLRQDGSDAMQAVLERARPFAEVLWDREWSAGDWSTPERRAQFEQNLRAKVALIQHAAVRGHYEQAMDERLAKVFHRDGASSRGAQGAERGGGRPFPAYGTGGWSQGAGQGRGKTRQRGFADKGRGAGGRSPPGREFGSGFGPPAASSSLLQSKLVAGEASQASYRENVILRTIVNHPWLIDDWSETIAEMPLHNLAFARFRDTLLEIHALSCPLDRTLLRDQLRSFGQDRVLAQLEQGATHRGDWFAEAEAPRETVELGWRHICALHGHQLVLKREIEAAEQAWHRDQTDAAFARLRDLNMRLNETDGKEAMIEGYGAAGRDRN